ncbi:MAG: hypothetical protein L0Y35_04730 [Flammeovirgaceae bacterium]|nr:hypothetical protein [Flammeovirgaceae bacterium]
MKYLPFFFFGLIFASCTEVSFTVPQPKGIKKLIEIPDQFVGKYVSTYSSETTDTLVISKTGYLIKEVKEKPDINLERGSLSDSLVIKFYRGYYFVNMKENDQWILRILRFSDNQLEFSSIDISTDEQKEKLKSLKPEILKIDGNTYYRINPSKKKILKLVQQQSPSGILKKVE